MTKIVRLTAENFKRLTAVEIVPDGNVVVISGRNHQGKTSILDGIFAVLKGAKVARETSQPIRDGQDTAWVRLEIGEDLDHVEYIATRRWTKDDAGTLTVESGDRAKYGSPQKLLDEIVGEVSFDPQQFLDMKASEQVEALVSALGPSLPFDPADLARERQGVYDRRTEVGREVKKLEGQLVGYPDADPSLPAEEVSAAAVLAEEDAARIHNSRIDAEIDELASLESDVDRAERALQDARRAITIAEDDLETAKNRVRMQRAALAELPERIDTAAIRERLQTVEQTNARVRAQQHRAAVAAELKDRRDEVARLTAELQVIDKKKADGIAAAKFPVPELSFDDTGVLFNGRAFSQASTEEQLRAAFGVAIAANPRLRVCRIDRGEALDSDGLALLGKLAAEHDMQVWVSKVDESGALGFVIEEGAVRS